MTCATAVVASSTRPPGTSITLRPSTPVEHLGEAIAELASRLHAATYELLVLLREFDAQAGWNNGFLSCAHWLSWRTGIDPGAAREKVRVARALASLPRLSGAMQRGEISYAKVRALTRVATPASEERLLDIAYAGTAAHVERVVRAWRRCDRVEAAQEAERRHLHRELHTWVDDDGMLVIRGRLTPELGAVVQRALEAASDALFRESAHAAHARSLADEATPAQRRADALGRLAECALAGDLDGGTVTDRYQVVLHVEAVPVAPAPPIHSPLEVSPPVGLAMEQTAIEVQDGGVGVSAETRERLSCDSSVVVMRHGSDGSVLDVGRKTRSIPPAIRRALQARDARCQFPGCAARRCDAHHLVHWAHGGSTGVENLTLLCRRHHRLVHEGGIGVRRGMDGRVTFHLANGGRIEPAPAPPVWTSADTATALTHTGGTGGGIASPAGGDDRIASHDPLAPTVDRLARMGVSIDAHSAPCWDGTPFSLALVIDTLLGTDRWWPTRTHLLTPRAPESNRVVDLVRPCRGARRGPRRRLRATRRSALVVSIRRRMGVLNGCQFASSVALAALSERTSSDRRPSSLARCQNSAAAARASSHTSRVSAVAYGNLKIRGSTCPSAEGA